MITKFLSLEFKCVEEQAGFWGWGGGIYFDKQVNVKWVSDKCHFFSGVKIFKS